MGERLRAYLRGPHLVAPGPSGRQMWQALSTIRRDPTTFLESMAQKFGDIVQFPVPWPPAFAINHPNDIRYVLVVNARNYDKQTMQYRGLSLLTGDGLLTADPPLWRERRTIIQPSFHHEAVAHTRADIDGAVNAALARWVALENIDLGHELAVLALDIVGRTLFGGQFKEGASELADITLKALDVVVARAQRPLSLPMSLPTPGNRALVRALSALESAVERLIARHDSEGAESNASERHSAPNLLNLLLAAFPDRDDEVQRRAVRDELVTFIVAGHETVATGLTWAFLWLLEHPQQVAELHSATPAESYIRASAIFEESLRLYPPAWLITRRARAADVIGGVQIPAGALIIISPSVVHRDSRWWRTPEDFNPERFLTTDDVRRGAYLPFGAGARMCIGREAALLQGAQVLARVCQKVTLESLAGIRRETIAGVTLRPKHPARVRVSWR